MSARVWVRRRLSELLVRPGLRSGLYGPVIRLLPFVLRSVVLPTWLERCDRIGISRVWLRWVWWRLWVPSSLPPSTSRTLVTDGRSRDVVIKTSHDHTLLKVKNKKPTGMIRSVFIFWTRFPQCDRCRGQAYSLTLFRAWRRFREQAGRAPWFALLILRLFFAI